MSPRVCAVCGRRLSASESVICASCMLHLPFTDYRDDLKGNPMARLFWGHFPVERAYTMFYYEPKSEVSQLIYDMKYHGLTDTCTDMGQIVAKNLDGSGFFDGIDALVPVPITRKRRWQRGYNQSELIAKGVSEVTRIPIYKHVVKRQHFLGSQTDKSRHERHENVEGAFLLTDSQAIRNKHLLLIDDIVTTGATITACAKELCKVEGVKVSVLTIGYTKT